MLFSKMAGDSFFQKLKPSQTKTLLRNFVSLFFHLPKPVADNNETFSFHYCALVFFKQLNLRDSSIGSRKAIYEYKQGNLGLDLCHTNGKETQKQFERV